MKAERVAGRSLIREGWEWFPPLLLIALALVALYHPLWVSLFQFPLSGSTNEGLGLFAPLLAGFLAWQRRERLRALPCSPDARGLWLLILGGGIAFLAHRLVMRFPLSLSLALVTAGAVWTALGRKWVTELWFPLFLLIAITPLPLDLVSAIAFRMQLIVARFVTLIIGLMGLPIQREGVTLLVQGYAVQVNEACSGWHAFSAAFWLFLTALYWQRPDRWWRCLWVFPFLLPIAVFANILRVTTVVLGGVYGFHWVSRSPWHEILGLIYFLALALLLLRLILKDQPAQTIFRPNPIKSFSLPPLMAIWRIAAVLTLLGGSTVLMAWQTRQAQAAFQPPTVPTRLGEWTIVDKDVEGVDDGYWFVRAIYRNAEGERGERVFIAHVFLHLPLNLVHRPKRLLNLWLGQGFMMAGGKTVTVPTPFRRVPVRLIAFVKGQRREHIAVTYLHPDRAVPSPVKARLWRMVEKLYRFPKPWLTVGVATPDPEKSLDLEKHLIAHYDRWLQRFR